MDTATLAVTRTGTQVHIAKTELKTVCGQDVWHYAVKPEDVDDLPVCHRCEQKAKA